MKKPPMTGKKKGKSLHTNFKGKVYSPMQTKKCFSTARKVKVMKSQK